MDKIFKLILEKLELLLFYDFVFSNRKWPQQKQFSPTFRNITFGEAKAL
jgi:hypothetical protein